MRQRPRLLRRHREPLTPSLAKVGQPPGELSYTGPAREHEVRATLLSFGEGGVEVLSQVPVEQALQVVAQADGRLHWLDLDGVHDLGALRSLGQVLRLDPLCLEELAHVGGRSKAVPGDGYLRLRLQLQRVSPAAFDTPAALHRDQLTLLLADDLLVSVQQQSGQLLEGLRARLRQDKGLSRHLGAGHLAATILDLAAEQGLVATAALAESLEELGEASPEEAGPVALSQLMDVERELVLLERIAAPLQRLLSALQEDAAQPLGGNAMPLLQAAASQATEVLELAAGLRRVAASLQQGYATAAGRRQAQNGRLLTVLAAFFLPLLLVALLAGPWLSLLPIMDWRWMAGGLAVALGLTALASRAWLRRRGLL